MDRGSGSNSVGRTIRAAWIASLLFLLSAPATALAADPLDPSFGHDGVSVSVTGENGELDAIARDGSGELVTSGTTERGFIVQRFHRDGSIDSSFGRDGAAETGFEGSAWGQALALQRDGKIVVAGPAYDRPDTAFVLARYLPDGKLDPHFGKRGRVVAGPKMYDGEAVAMAIQPNGKILVAGWAADTHFGFTGILMRFKPNGELDLSFSHNGYARIRGGDGSFLSAVAVLPSGKILVAGEMFGRFMMLRVFPDGRSDPSFGGDGFVVSDTAPHPSCRCAHVSDLALLPHGRILLSGRIEEKGQTFATLARYLPNGQLDQRFGGGVVWTRSSHVLAMEDMAIDRRNGKVTLAGYRLPKHAHPQVAVLRYLPSGHLDPSFAASGMFTRHLAYESVARSLLLEPDGSAVVAGRLNRSRAGIHEGPGEEFVSSVLEKGEYLLMRFRP